MSSPKFRASGLVAADLDRVASLLTTAATGPVTPTNGWIVHRTGLGATELRGGPDRFDVLNGKSETLILDIDHERNIAALQGHWWYRGEYEATRRRMAPG
ncbi:MAG TPA: hypothetical protein VHX59_23600 [Mycobacteriales bacterium]|jgi:hypothetical protein|nr:hypothetical protein [Mycobacteriales bacterium]